MKNEDKVLNLQLTEQEYERLYAKYKADQTKLQNHALYLRIHWRAVQSQMKRLKTRMDELELQRSGGSMLSPLVCTDDVTLDPIQSHCERVLTRFRAYSQSSQAIHDLSAPANTCSSSSAPPI